MNKVTLILTLLLTGLNIFSQSQRLIFEELTIKNGLNPNQDAIFQDNKGFIWFGSWRGLLRYDGYDLVNYDLIKDEVMTIYAITEDSRGILWISTNIGISLMNPENEKLVHYIPYPKLFPIYKVFEDKDGIIWCAAEAGLLKLEPKIKEETQLKELIFQKGIEAAFSIFVYADIKVLNNTTDNLKNVGISDICEDIGQRLWIGTKNGLFIFDKARNEFMRIDDADGISRLNDTDVSSIIIENPDVIWVRTHKAFTRISNINQAFSKAVFDKTDLIIDNYLNMMYNIGESGTTPNMFLIDQKKNFWFGTWNNGLYNMNMDDNKNIKFEELYTKLPELQRNQYDNTGTIMEDRTGLLWVVFYNKGIMKLRIENNLFTSMEGMLEKYYLLSKEFWQLYEDDDGNLWIGSWLNGLFKISRDGKVSNYKIIDPNVRDPMENHITALLEVEKGKFWVAGYGIWQLDSKTGICEKLFTKSDETLNAYVNTLLKIGNYVLIPTFNQDGPAQGLWVCDFKTRNLKKYTVQQNDSLGLKSNNIISVNEIKNGEIWVSTGNHGLNRIRLNQATGELSFLPLPEAVKLNKQMIVEDSRFIFRVYEDSKGILWFGTATGLVKLNLETGEVKKWTEKDGLYNNIVGFIEEDNQGNLWLGSGYGLSMLDPLTERIKTFDKSDGLPYDGLWAPFKNKNGLIYFAGTGGFCRFNPDDMEKNNMIPSVVITDFRLFNKPVKVASTKKAVLTANISFTQEISLNYNQNDLSFTFAALDYNNPSKNRYAYILEEYQKEWIETGADNRTASFTNLNPGKYVFRVKGSNNDGVWNEEGTFINIIIHPPFWRTKLAYIAYFLLTLLLLRGYIYWRTRRLRKEKIVLEKQVNERTEELKTANDLLEKQQEELQEVNILLEEQNEELVQQKEELQSTLENLQKTQEQLIESEKMAAIGGLVAGVAHEINTPVGIGITAISNLVDDVQKMAGLYEKDLISRKEFKGFLESAYDTAKLIQKNLERTAALVQSFKQVSADQASEQQRVFALKEYLNDILLSLRPKFREKNITFKIECDDKLQLNSFPGIYAQIFTNLLLNSLQHGFPEKDTGTIGIKTDINKEWLKIRYTDDGAGISKKDLPHIFEPFYTSDKHRGTGLGLNIVYNLVRQRLHGTITCESEPEKGVLFKIDVPMK